MIVQTQNIQFFKLLHKGLFLFLDNKEMLIVNKKLHLQTWQAKVDLFREKGSTLACPDLYRVGIS